METAVIDNVGSYERERGKPMPSRNHAIVQMNLGIEFARNKQYRVLSELALDLGGRPFTPDLSVYPRQPVDFRHDDVRVTEPPLLTVEIFSPTQGYQELMDKVDAYLNNGVKSCWVVNPPQRAITIYLVDGSEKTYVEGEVKDPVTGLSADLHAVFS
jgi:Uma2 family endonuclease